MNALAKLAAGILLSAIPLHSTLAATVTMTRTPNVTRTQTQGAGNYDVYDFYWTNAPGAQFTNYTVTGSLTSGSFFDPARLQDDRQTNPAAAGQDGNTAGAVDMWANTVWSAAGKTDLGLTATILADPAGYAPTGSGVSPAFTYFKWDVFDNVLGDDNDLNNDGDNPTSATAPYHIMRVLTSPGGANGEITFQAYDTSQPGVAFIYNFGLIIEGILTHVVDAEIVVLDTLYPGFVDHTFGYTGAPPVGWDNFEFLSYTPNYGALPDAPGALAAANATFDPSDAGFHWTTTGAPSGDYVWRVRVSDQFGPADTGTLTIHVLVPEPSAVALCGAFLLAISGLARRRQCSPST